MLKIRSNNEKILQRNSKGIGNISKTIAENNIGLVMSGQWLGEEIILLQTPMLYSAVALTDVRLFKISV
jgi:CRP-like cAMP-binding protein